MEHGIALDKEVGLERNMTRRRWRWKMDVMWHDYDTQALKEMHGFIQKGTLEAYCTLRRRSANITPDHGNMITNAHGQERLDKIYISTRQGRRRLLPQTKIPNTEKEKKTTIKKDARRWWTWSFLSGWSQTPKDTKTCVRVCKEPRHNHRSCG
jgi:hypothetical protein